MKWPRHVLHFFIQTGFMVGASTTLNAFLLSFIVIYVTKHDLSTLTARGGVALQ